MLAVLLLGGVTLVSCGTDTSSRETNHPPSPSVTPADRAVRIETTGCGYASGRTGSGVAIGDGLVVTVAHLLVHGEGVHVTVEGGDAGGAVVAAVDLQRDLALLRLEPDGKPDVETSTAAKGDKGLIVGGATSGTGPFEVERMVDLTIEDVLGTDRHDRLGYELAAATDKGDSGAGAYDEEGRLIGIVFATSDEGAATWVTASTEIDDFVATVGPAETYALCE